MANLLATKPLDVLMTEAQDSGEHSLKRALGPINLITLGIGAIIGAGIFVLTGQAAAMYAGPAIILSYVLAGLGCAFAGLCYAEFASLIPIAGSAYTYGYATLGEIFAWIIGWDLILEYAFGAATVASGWSSTLVAFLQDYGINLPPQICDVPGAKWSMVDGRWAPDSTFAMDQLSRATQHATTTFNLVAFLAIIAVTIILIIGIRESANFNTTVVFIKLIAVVTFIVVAGAYVIKNPAIAHVNWSAFLPANTGHFGAYGWSGVLRAAGVVFFAYIGFDAVSTAAQEAKNPQKDMPIGILGSLLICTVLYLLVSGILTATVSYTRLNIGAPVSLAIHETGVKWGSYVVNAGALAGLSTVMLVMLLGQSRVFYSMAHDGLLWKWAGDIHPRFRTPWKSTAITGVVVATIGSLVPIGDLGQMVSIGTLMAFVIVCAGVWVMRRRRPELKRPFRTPWVPFVPIMGMAISLAMMLGLNGLTWLRLIIWLEIGMFIYFSYGEIHSRVQARQPRAARLTESYKTALGLAGAAALAVGVFTPVVTTDTGYVSYWHYEIGLALVIFGAVANAILFSLTARYRHLVAAGGVALFSTLIPFVILWRESATTGHFDWGWAVLVIGSVLLIATGLLNSSAAKQEATSDAQG